MHRSLHSRIPLGTLALGVKAMTSPIAGTVSSLSPVDAILNLDRMEDIIEVLRVSGSLRPMCLNCQYLTKSADAKIEDYAAIFTNKA